MLHTHTERAQGQAVLEYLLVAAALTAVFLVLALQVAGKVGSVAGNAVSRIDLVGH